jgi:MFS family permease
MTPVLLLVAAVLTAVAAAIRSTWSPCGLSMLSSITPLAERGRHRRFGWTASWFVVGGALGGATFGLVGAAGAAVLRATAPSPRAVGIAVLLAAGLAVAVDLGMVPPALPHHRRQVNELWLTRYRGWVTGLGFGWQIGNGVGTYIMTAGVYLLAALAILSGNPVLALGAGTLFGLVRGLAILLVAGVTNPARLARFHRRFDEAREPVRTATIAAEGVVAVLAATATGGPAAGIASVALVGLAAVLRAGRAASGAEANRAPAPAR